MFARTQRSGLCVTPAVIRSQISKINTRVDMFLSSALFIPRLKFLTLLRLSVRSIRVHARILCIIDNDMSQALECTVFVQSQDDQAFEYTEQ